MGGRHNATRKINKALKNQARVQRNPSGSLQTYLAQNRVGLRPVPYSKFAVPGQTVRVSPLRREGTMSGTTADHALKVHRMLAKGPSARRPFIPHPGNIGKSKRGYKK